MKRKGHSKGSKTLLLGMNSVNVAVFRKEVRNFR